MAGQETRRRFFTARSHCLLTIIRDLFSRERKEGEVAQADNSLKRNQEDHLLVLSSVAVTRAIVLPDEKFHRVMVLLRATPASILLMANPYHLNPSSGMVYGL